jgi:hypothetical protein
MTNRAPFLIVLCLAVLLPSMRPLSAQSSSALINEALDKIVTIKIADKTPLPQVMESITRDSGVPIEADPSIWELLPWGDQTSVAATFEQITLREALEALARKLGLTFVLRDQSVQIRPMPALRRLGRRATVQEIAVLDLLASTPAQAQGGADSVNQLLQLIDTRLQEAKSPFAIENRAFDATTGQAQVPLSRNFTLAEALESIHRSTGATWYPWGDSIIVSTKEDQVRAQLARAVDARFNGVELSQVLSELSRQAGVPFAIEPGAVQQVAPELRTVRLVLDNTTIQQALESIAGFTGLGYVVNAEGVYIWNRASGGLGGQQQGRDPLLGLIELDKGMQVILPQSAVPADIQEYLRAKVQRRVQELRKQMVDEGFVPATRPATEPAGDDL